MPKMVTTNSMWIFDNIPLCVHVASSATNTTTKNLEIQQDFVEIIGKIVLVTDNFQVVMHVCTFCIR